MKNGPGHRGSFMQRWLSRSTKASNIPSYGGSDTESNSTRTFSPPPLTDSSSTSASSSEIPTPKASPVQFPRKRATSRFTVSKTPQTPPTRYAELPPVQTIRKAAVSLPPISRLPTALVVAQPQVKLHHLLSYYPMRRPLIYDISSPTSYIRQTPSQIISRRHPMPSSHALIPRPSSLQSQSRRFPLPPSRGLAPQPTTLSDQDLLQYATTPPVTRMHIVCDIMPWSIRVRGRNEVPNDPKSYVRVVDVLDGIYHSLRTCVSEREWDRTPKPYRDCVKKAYFERCARARAYSLKGYEEKEGVRRVDWFLEKTMFLGLTTITFEGGVEGRSDRSDEGDVTWALMVEPR